MESRAENGLACSVSERATRLALDPEDVTSKDANRDGYRSTATPLGRHIGDMRPASELHARHERACFAATFSVPPLGFEPRTHGLKVRCSTN